MKTTLISILIAFFSINAQADQIATYEFGVHATHQSYDVINATLDDSGELSVSVSTRSLNGDSLPVIAMLHTKKLHPENFQRLFHYVTVLSKAEIKEEIFGAVCEIYVAPHMFVDNLYVARDYDYVSQEFKGEYKYVFGPQGCWTGHNVYPVVDNQRDVAVRLKETLRTLALEILN